MCGRVVRGGCTSRIASASAATLTTVSNAHGSKVRVAARSTPSRHRPTQPAGATPNRGMAKFGCYTCIMVQVRKRRPMSPRQASSCCRPVDGLLDPILFRVLGDPTRVTMLACLIKCGRECTVSEVAECCSVDLSVVSRHLQALARAGVLTAHKSGRTVSYSVRYADLCRTLRDLANSIEECAPTGTCGSAAGARCGRC